MQLFCGILVLIAVPAVVISYLVMLFEDVKKNNKNINQEKISGQVLCYNKITKGKEKEIKK